MHPFATMRRLHDRGPACRGLAVDAEGVMLGPDCSLVRHTPLGYRCADPDELARLTRDVFDGDARLSRLPIVLAGIVKALDGGDLLKAQLLGLEIPIGELNDDRLQRLRAAKDLIKDGFDPNQPRDERGRWARESGAAARMTPATPPKSSFLGRVAPGALRALAQMGTRLSAPTAFFGITLVPTNRSLITEGTLPDRQDLSFEYDAGARRLRLYQDGDAGRQLVFQGNPDLDGIIRDDKGHAIGRRIDGSVVIIDPDALPDAGLGSPRDSGRDKPKLCPDTTEESTEGRKTRSIEYQTYVSGLRPGLDVKLTDPATGRDVKFDGCRESDGTMLEAKGPGYLEKLRENHPIVWHSMEAEFDDQARRQSRAALADGGRRIEWHFADVEVMEHFRERWGNQFPNITLIHTPPPSDKP